MKASELRIGNYVQNKEAHIYTVAFLDDESGRDFSIRAWQLNLICRGISDEAIEPIPLTEEWLLRFEFKDDNKSDREKYKLAYKDFVRLKKKDNYFRIYIEKEVGFHLDRFNAPYVIKLEYVHQLQNLYFALTGEELKLNA